MKELQAHCLLSAVMHMQTHIPCSVMVVVLLEDQNLYHLFSLVPSLPSLPFSAWAGCAGLGGQNGGLGLSVISMQCGWDLPDQIVYRVLRDCSSGSGVL